MNEVVIDVQGLGKKYRLGAREKGSDTIMGSIVNGLTGPIRNFRSIRGLSSVGHNDDRVFWAIKDVSFRVSRGEVLGVIGHNGAGKSTLLKILSRITEPSTGEVVIRGRVSSLLEVGTGFHPELTGRENIYMNGTILGMTRREIDRKLEEIVDFSGVQRHIDTPVKFYSSGMKVRLGFSVAAHLEPDILIIDEVLAVGDLEFQRKCLGKIEASALSGKTVLFVSHNLSAVTNLCSRCILLDGGMVSQDGAPVEIVNSYIGVRVASKQLEDTESDIVRTVYFVNVHDEKCHEFLFEEGFSLCIELNKITSRSQIGLVISDEYDRRVFIDFCSIDVADSDSTVLASFPKAHLSPGRYYVSMSLMDAYKKVYWMRKGICHFQILKLASKFEGIDYDCGVVNSFIQWKK